MDLDYFLSINYGACIGIIMLFVVLLTNTTIDKNIKMIFFALLILETIELIAYNLELETATWSYLSNWRILLSAIGYSIRPALLYLILRLSIRRTLKLIETVAIITPLILNALIAFSAFWTNMSYSYTEANVFVRGPLGITPFLTLGLYMIAIIIHTIKLSNIKSLTEEVIVIGSVFICVGAMLIEFIFQVRNTGRISIVMATIFYYMFFQSQTYISTLNKERSNYKTLEVQSKRDKLTGLLNKVSFLEEADELLSSSVANVALVFFDLDNFKNANDTLGHLFGDELLKSVACKLKEIFRESDIIGRFGGDEFYILMYNTTYEGVYKKMDELLAAMQMEYSNGAATVKISASIGVAYLEKEKSSKGSEMLAFADSAVYEAKHSGRNQYIVKVI